MLNIASVFPLGDHQLLGCGDHDLDKSSLGLAADQGDMNQLPGELYVVRIGL